MIQFLKSEVAAFRLIIIGMPCFGVFPLTGIFFLSPSSPDRTYWAYYTVFCFLIATFLFGSFFRDLKVVGKDGKEGRPVFPKFLVESAFSPIKTMLLDFFCQAIVVFFVTSPLLLVCVWLFGFDDAFWSIIGAAVAARFVGTALLWIVGRINIYLAFGIAVVCMVGILIGIALMKFESALSELQVFVLISVMFIMLAVFNSKFPFVKQKEDVG